MSYVQANTSNPLGRRNLGRLGWQDLPQPVYGLSRSVARLNGEAHDGAVTYRIDPRSGQYQFYRTDIRPRGIFMQNTFQHPAPPVMSALGVPVLPIGKSVSASTLQRGRTSLEPTLRMRPGLQLSGLGCTSCPCAGRCKSAKRGRLGRLGADECSLDSDCGPGSVCAAGVCVTQEIPVAAPNISVPQFAPVPVPPDPNALVAAGAIAQGIQQVVQTATGPRIVVVQQKPWLSGTSNIGGVNVPNSVLTIGGVLFAALGLERSGGRRR